MISFFEDLYLHPQILPNFEEIVNNQTPAFLERQYRNMYVCQQDIDRVRNNRGEHCFASVSGSGYSSWYFYHTMDDRLVFIIETWLNGQKHLTWQYGVPPEREVIDAIVIDDIILENDNVIVDEIDIKYEEYGITLSIQYIIKNINRVGSISTSLTRAA